MKKTLAVFLSTALLMLFAAGCSSSGAGGEVLTFEDAGFEQFVRTLLGKSEGDITEGDLSKFTCLRFLQGKQVVASTQNAHNIDEDNSLTEGELRSYEMEIEFENPTLLEEVGSWEELRYFTGLEDFEADGISMASLSFLDAMPNLTNLALSGDEFGDLSPITSCENLGFLALRIPSLTAPVLPENPDKLIYLYLESDALTDIGGVAACESLLHFAAAGNGRFDLGVLTGLPVLREVELRGEGITDIQVLAACPAVESMTFSIDAIEDLEANVEAMAPMPKLQILNLLSSREFEGETGQDWFASLDEATKNAVNRLRAYNSEIVVLINGQPVA
ncbi:hypothetical protein LJC49_04920 [Ruminococcaceae bacterium OttesenSCG-928-I18]|nr:hypothetical protein [Ruminococcaceae bacterium OttesenSCG-928-I18]